MIVLDNQLISIVDDVGFKKLVQVLEPRYNFPNHCYFAEVVIPDMYQLAEYYYITDYYCKLWFVTFVLSLYKGTNLHDDIIIIQYSYYYICWESVLALVLSDTSCFSTWYLNIDKN